MYITSLSSILSTPGQSEFVRATLPPSVHVYILHVNMTSNAEA